MEKSKKHKSWWRPISHFATHTAVGAMMLICVALPAVLLAVLIHHLPLLGVDGFTLELLNLLEKTVLVLDAVLFLVYVGSAAYESIKEMFK